MVWRDGDFPRWEAPGLTDRIIDLRNLTACATEKTPQGYVLIATERAPIPNEVLLASSFNESLSANARDAVKDLLQIPETISAANLSDLVNLLLGVYSDPSVGLICQPLMPGRSGLIRCSLGEIFFTYRCPTVGTQWENILKVLHGQYRSVKQSAAGGLHRKLLSVWQRKFGIENHEVFIPSDLPKETQVRPTTTIRDNFNVGNHADIDTQNSSDGDWAWGKIEGGGSNVVNTNTSTAGQYSLPFGQVVVYRANKDLSENDYYVESILGTDAIELFPGLIARKDSSATNTYYLLILNAISDEFDIYKRISGTYTLLQQNFTTFNLSTNYTVKFNIDGSTIQSFKDGTQIGADLTDTAIATGLRTGIYGSTTGVAGTFTGTVEDFEASDDDAADTVVLREELALTDRLSYFLLSSLEATIRETTGLADRLTYSMLQTYSVTMRETLGMTDGLNGAAITAIERTLREVLGLSEGGGEAAGGGVSGETQDNTGSGGAGIVVLTHIDFEEGREGYSGPEVVAPAHTHAAQVINFGTLEKEVEIPSGPPRFSDVTIEMNDNPDPITGVQYFRSKFGTRTPRNRKGDILVGPVGGKEHLFQKPAKYIVTEATFPPGRVRINGSDQRFKAFDKPLPGLINHVDFASQVALPPGVTDAFAPIIYGNVSSVGHGDQGAIKAIHVDTVRHWYCVARHPVQSVVVYRKSAGEAVFTEIPGGWELIFFEFLIDERHHTFSFVQFGSDQAGAEIRVDVAGLDVRGAWGMLPPIVTSNVSRNPVDHTINALFYARQKIGVHIDFAETDFSEYNTASFSEVYQKCEDLGYLSDFAVTTPLTSQEVLTRLHSPFAIHLIPDNFDRLKLVLITDSDLENAPEIDDLNGILMRSEMISLASPTFNRYRYRSAFKPAEDQWGRESTFDNSADQEEMGEVQELQVDFYAVSDETVAANCIAERSRWESIAAQRMHFQLDLPSHLDKIELLKPIKVSHYGGLEDGGWIDQLFIPYRIAQDYQGMVIGVDCIRRPIITIPVPQLHIGNWAWNHRGGPEYLTSRKRLYQVFRDNRSANNKMIVLGSNSAGEMIPVDDGIYPATANVIRSSDSVWYENKAHIITQEETTGRVAYTRFNGTSGVYEVLNQTILASNSDGDVGVTLDVQDPSGRVTAIFYGDREFSSGFAAFPAAGPAGDYRRAYMSVRQDNGTWAAPVMLGDPSAHSATLWFPIWGSAYYNGAVHVNIGRAIRGENNRVHHIFSISEPGDVANTPDFYIQTLRTDGTLSAAFEWQFTGGGGNSSVFLGGDPCSFEDGDGQFWLAMPIGELTQPKVMLWKDKDNPTVPDNTILLSTAETPPDTFGTRCVSIGVRYLEGQLHILHATRAPATEEWAAYKTVSAPFSTAICDPSYTAGARDVQCGARWPATTYGGHGFDIKRLTDGNVYIFKATGGTAGVPGVDDVDHILERIAVTDLPTDYTLAEWVAENA